MACADLVDACGLLFPNCVGTDLGIPGSEFAVLSDSNIVRYGQGRNFVALPPGHISMQQVPPELSINSASLSKFRQKLSKKLISRNSLQVFHHRAQRSISQLCQDQRSQSSAPGLAASLSLVSSKRTASPAPSMNLRSAEKSVTKAELSTFIQKPVNEHSKKLDSSKNSKSTLGLKAKL